MFLFHTIELTHCTRHQSPVQVMNKQVPVFRARPSFLERMIQSGEYLYVTFKMPVEGNGRQHKTNEREGTVQLVRRGMHYSSQMCSWREPTAGECGFS